MGQFSFVIKDPNKAYLGSQLWLPKAHVNTRSIKASLEFEVRGEEGQEFLQMWEESPHHLAVPREYLLQEDYETLTFPIVDLTPKDFPRTRFKSNLILDFKEPKEMTQRDAYAVLKDKDNGLLQLACGKGKTCLALHKIAHEGRNALIIVNQKTILSQWEGAINQFLEFDGCIGRVQGAPEKWDWRHPIVIGMLHSLARHPDAVTPEMRRWFGIVIWDECFVAGTLVDGMPIEQRRVGDLVWSFNEASGLFQKQPIEKIFASRPWALVSIFIDGEEIICTPGHPFWTLRGWVPAYLLTCADMVLCSTHEQEHLRMWEASCWERHWKDVREVQTAQAGRADDEVRASLFPMQEAGAGVRSIFDGVLPQNETSILLQGMHEASGFGRSFRTHAAHQYQACQGQLSQDEEKQSYEGSKGAREATNYFAGHGVASAHSRRKWQAYACSSENAVECSRMGYGSGCVNWQGRKSERTIDALQDRHCQFDFDGSHRDRRPFSQLPYAQEAGQKKGSFSSWKRVEGVEVHQPTSDGTFGGRCPDGLVYNLQIRGTPTYRISRHNAVVHNCHHLSAPYFCITATMFTGQRLGLTATAKREDGTEVIYNYHLGEIFHKDA
jgi:hypothetical protein